MWESAVTVTTVLSYRVNSGLVVCLRQVHVYVFKRGIDIIYVLVALRLVEAHRHLDKGIPVLQHSRFTRDRRRRLAALVKAPDETLFGPLLALKITIPHRNLRDSGQ